MINLDDNQKRYIVSKNRGSILIDNKKHYFKHVNPDLEGLEILVENLAKYVEINCAHYEIVEVNGKKYYLSEDIAGKDDFWSAYEIGLYDISLYDIWNSLEERYPKQSKYLMEQIVKMYVFDIFVLNSDRHSGNYGFKVVDGELKDLYILDNEVTFAYSEIILSSKLYIDDELNNKPNIDKAPPEFEFGIDELDYFIQTSSEEYRELVKNMYDILTPDLINKELEKLNINALYKNDYLDVYTKNYQIIGNLLTTRGLK